MLCLSKARGDALRGLHTPFGTPTASDALRDESDFAVEEPVRGRRFLLW